MPWTDLAREIGEARDFGAKAGPRCVRHGFLTASTCRRVRERLTALEEFLRPKDLVDQVNGVVLGIGPGSIDLDDLDEIENDDYAGADARMNRTVENLGKDVANDDEAFKTLLPGLVRGGSRVPLFGEGLASSTEQALRDMASFRHRIYGGGTARYGRYGWLLERPTKAGLPRWPTRCWMRRSNTPRSDNTFRNFRPGVAIDERGVKRLHRALELGKRTHYPVLCAGLWSRQRRHSGTPNSAIFCLPSRTSPEA